MTLTLLEITKRLAAQYDEITLLEILNISSEDLVEAFLDRIEDKYEYFNNELSDYEEAY
jgi:cell division septum initiation protein DivIVA